MVIKLLSTNAPASVLIIRLMVGTVFISEGLQKFLFPESVGAGRFEKIGFSSPELVASMVGSFEILCGALVVAGLLTRLAVIPLIVIMLTAIATTKLPILNEQGFWKMAHEGRTDWSMLLGSTFLLLVGAGPISWDSKLSSRGSKRQGKPSSPPMQT